jgi:hypothetical protein
VEPGDGVDQGGTTDLERPPGTERRETASVELHRLAPRREAPIAVALTIASVLGLLVWAPWGREAPSTSEASPTAGVLRANASAMPSSVVAVRRASAAPTLPAVVAGTLPYRSITDNEWTIVALLTPDAAPSTEEPANPHVAVPAPSAAGPFVVLQQGVSVARDPIESPDPADAACPAPGGARGQAVRLPAGRVVYVGVTFPGMDPRARVDAVILGRPSVELTEARVVDVELSGMSPDRTYTVPSSGPGGTILFTTTPTTRLPSAPYRFELSIPGNDGPRFVYACVGG